MALGRESGRLNGKRLLVDWTLRGRGRPACRRADKYGPRPPLPTYFRSRGDPRRCRAIAVLAGELAAAVADPPPAFDVAHFLDQALGPDPWCQGFVAERDSLLVGYALVCRGCEAHTGQRPRPSGVANAHFPRRRSRRRPEPHARAALPRFRRLQIPCTVAG